MQHTKSRGILSELRQRQHLYLSRGGALEANKMSLICMIKPVALTVFRLVLMEQGITYQNIVLYIRLHHLATFRRSQGHLTNRNW